MTKQPEGQAPASAPVPFSNLTPPAPQHSGGTDIEVARAAREVETAMIVARRFPRDIVQARQRILQACTRPSLAEGATYAYKRGSTLVTGPSIRLAEAMAQSWGNIEFGIRELSQEDGKSSVQAYAYDLETNTRQTKNFLVPHLRFTKEGITRLTDPRDIYEAVANQGARRLRACILGVIPGDVVDEAVAQCEHTLANAGGAPAEQLKKLVAAFAEIGVSSDMLAHKLGHALTNVAMAEVIRLRQVYAAIRDGMTSVRAEFTQQSDESTTTSAQPSKPKNAKEAAKAAAQAAQRASATLSEFEERVKATQPGSELQAVLDEAKGVLNEAHFDLLRRFAERTHGGSEGQS